MTGFLLEHRHQQLQEWRSLELVYEADSARIGDTVAINANTSTMHNNLLFVMFIVPPFGILLGGMTKIMDFPGLVFHFRSKAVCQYRW